MRRQDRHNYLHAPFLCLMINASWRAVVRWARLFSARACLAPTFFLSSPRRPSGMADGVHGQSNVTCHNGKRVYACSLFCRCALVYVFLSLRQRTLISCCTCALFLFACYGQARTSGWLGFSLARMKGGWTALDRFSRLTWLASGRYRFVRESLTSRGTCTEIFSVLFSSTIHSLPCPRSDVARIVKSTAQPWVFFSSY